MELEEIYVYVVTKHLRARRPWSSTGIDSLNVLFYQPIMKYKLHANFSFMQINLYQITNCISFYVNNCSSESTEDDVEKDVVEEATEIATEDSRKNIAEEANKVEEST